MDYSLLLAIEKVQTGMEQEHREDSRHVFYSSCGKYVYHLAIIDYLQTYNMHKQMESKFKTNILVRQRELISAVEPKLYGERFIKFMKNEVILDTIL